MNTLVPGDKIPDAEALEALPIGTAVTERGSSKLLTRHPDSEGVPGGWASHYNRNPQPSSDVWWDGMSLVSLPGVTYDGPMIGDQITSQQQLDALPAAAVIHRVNDTNNYSAWKIGPDTPSYEGYENQWYDSYWGRLTAERFAHNMGREGVTYEVESLPVDLFETLDQFKWRFRDLAITGEERALGYSTTSVGIMETLGIEFSPSVGMRITNKNDRSALPDGTRVYVGSPEDEEQFALYTREGGQWVKVFGKTNVNPQEAVAVVIDAVPDIGGMVTEPAEWFTKVPTPQDAQEVRALRRSGWIEGLKKKRENSWCDEFERVMLRGGMSDALTQIPLPEGIKVGDKVDVRQAALLPLGSILTVQQDDQLVGVYQRVEGAPNKAGTVRVWGRNGWEKKGNYQPEMTLANNMNDGSQIGVEGLCPIPDLAFMATLPLGSRISQGGQHFYQKVVDVRDGRTECWSGTRWDQEREPQNYAEHKDKAFFSGTTCAWSVSRFGPA